MRKRRLRLSPLDVVLLVVAVLSAVFAASLTWKWRIDDPPAGVHDCRIHPAHGCMVAVPGGSFLMGAQAESAGEPGYDPKAQRDEGPPRTVEVSPFWMHQFEVATADVEQCVQRGGCRPEHFERSGGFFTFGDGRRRSLPANGVAWQGAADYCRWIGARLPTEAEWEYAARGGSRALPYVSSLEPPACPDAVTQNGCGKGSQATGISPFGPFELGGLAGNLWEWTADWYGEDAYREGAARDPRGPAAGTRRVQRGGAWTTVDPLELRSAHRAALEPDLRLEDVGFRCVADPPVRTAWEAFVALLGSDDASPSTGRPKPSPDRAAPPLPEAR